MQDKLQTFQNRAARVIEQTDYIGCKNKGKYRSSLCCIIEDGFATTVTTDKMDRLVTVGLSDCDQRAKRGQSCRNELWWRGGGRGGDLLPGLSFPKIVTIGILNNVCTVCMYVKLYLMTLAPSANAGFRGGRLNI